MFDEEDDTLKMPTKPGVQSFVCSEEGKWSLILIKRIR